MVNTTHDSSYTPLFLKYTQHNLKYAPHNLGYTDHTKFGYTPHKCLSTMAHHTIPLILFYFPNLNSPRISEQTETQICSTWLREKLLEILSKKCSILISESTKTYFFFLTKYNEQSNISYFTNLVSRASFLATKLDFH